MSGYTIIGFDGDEAQEAIERAETPVAVVGPKWDRYSRSYVTMMVNADGHQVGDANYDGNKADAAASKAMLEREVATYGKG